MLKLNRFEVELEGLKLKTEIKKLGTQSATKNARQRVLQTIKRKTNATAPKIKNNSKSKI